MKLYIYNYLGLCVSSGVNSLDLATSCASHETLHLQLPWLVWYYSLCVLDLAPSCAYYNQLYLCAFWEFFSSVFVLFICFWTHNYSCYDEVFACYFIIPHKLVRLNSLPHGCYAPVWETVAISCACHDEVYLVLSLFFLSTWQAPWVLFLSRKRPHHSWALSVGNVVFLGQSHKKHVKKSEIE